MIKFNFKTNIPKTDEDPFSFNLSLQQSARMNKRICTYESIIKQRVFIYYRQISAQKHFFFRHALMLRGNHFMIGDMKARRQHGL